MDQGHFAIQPRPHSPALAETSRTRASANTLADSVPKSANVSRGKDEKAEAYYGGQPWSYPYNAPAVVRGLAYPVRFRKVVGGEAHTLALTTTGELWSFGRNKEGQLGLGDVKTRKNPQFVRALYGIDVVDVCCGARHSLVVDRESRSYVFGDNAQGQLGITSFKRLLVPTLLEWTVRSRVRSVGGGGSHSIIVDEAHNIWVTGSNKYGQLGYSPMDDVRVREWQPLYQFRRLDIVSVFCGLNHTVLLSAGGSAFTCGRGANFQLGHGTSTDKHRPTLVQVFDSLDLSVVYASAGSEHTIFLTDEDDVFMVGSNEFGQLGFGSDVKHASLPTVLRFSDQEDTQWDATATAQDPVHVKSPEKGIEKKQIPFTRKKFVQAVVEEGAEGPQKDSILEWELNQHVEAMRKLLTRKGRTVGSASTGDDRKDSEGKEDTRTWLLTDLSAGYHHSCFVTDRGELYACGCGSHGRLGLGIKLNAYTPKRVKGMLTLARLKDLKSDPFPPQPVPEVTIKSVDRVQELTKLRSALASVPARVRKAMTDAELLETKRTFDQLDEDGSGYLDKDEMFRAFQVIGEYATREAIEAAYREYAGEDDRIDFGEFILLVLDTRSAMERQRRKLTRQAKPKSAKPKGAIRKGNQKEVDDSSSSSEEDEEEEASATAVLRTGLSVLPAGNEVSSSSARRLNQLIEGLGRENRLLEFQRCFQEADYREENELQLFQAKDVLKEMGIKLSEKKLHKIWAPTQTLEEFMNTSFSFQDLLKLYEITYARAQQSRFKRKMQGWRYNPPPRIEPAIIHRFFEAFRKGCQESNVEISVAMEKRITEVTYPLKKKGKWAEKGILDLRNIGMRDTHCISFARSLKAYPIWKTILMNGNRITDAGVGALHEAARFQWLDAEHRFPRGTGLTDAALAQVAELPDLDTTQQDEEETENVKSVTVTGIEFSEFQTNTTDLLRDLKRTNSRKTNRPTKPKRSKKFLPKVRSQRGQQHSTPLNREGTERPAPMKEEAKVEAEEKADCPSPPRPQRKEPLLCGMFPEDIIQIYRSKAGRDRVRDWEADKTGEILCRFCGNKDDILWFADLGVHQRFMRYESFIQCRACHQEWLEAPLHYLQLIKVEDSIKVERLLVLKKFQLQNSSRDHVIRLIEDGPISIGSIRKEHTAFIKKTVTELVRDLKRLAVPRDTIRDYGHELLRYGTATFSTHRTRYQRYVEDKCKASCVAVRNAFILRCRAIYRTMRLPYDWYLYQHKLSDQINTSMEELSNIMQGWTTPSEEFDKFHSELSELAVMLVNYARDLQDHTHIVEVNAGALSSYAVSQYGELWVMGDGSHGQLGSGATNPAFTPEIVLVARPSIEQRLVSSRRIFATEATARYKCDIGKFICNIKAFGYAVFDHMTIPPKSKYCRVRYMSNKPGCTIEVRMGSRDGFLLARITTVATRHDDMSPVIFMVTPSTRYNSASCDPLSSPLLQLRLRKLTLLW